MYRKVITTAAVLCLSSTGLHAENVDFLSDYSKLAEGGKSGFTRVYIAPGALDSLGGLTTVLVDQPEFFIDPKSKYKGMKPADAEVVGEELRAAMIRGIGDGVNVVDEPVEGSGLITWAVTNVRMNKAKRGVLGYTPVGAVAYGVKKQMSDIVDKTRAFDVTFEIEGSDAETGEVLFAMVFDMTEAGVEAEWGDALVLTEGVGKRISCRMTNTRLAVADRVDCQAIPIK